MAFNLEKTQLTGMMH